MSRTLFNLKCIPRLLTVWSTPARNGGFSQMCVWQGHKDLNEKCARYMFCSHKPFHSLCQGQQISNPTGHNGSHELLLPQNNYMLSYCQRRGKAKGKVKGKKDKKEKKSHKEKQDDDVDNDEDDHAASMQKFKTQLQWQCEHLKEQYIAQLGLRTNLSSYEGLDVVLDKSQTVPLNQLAQITQKSSQLVQINMAASPQYMKEVKTALMKSGLNVNPQQEGTSLFINIPKVTKEHRENLAKNAEKLFKDAKQQMVQFQSKLLKVAKRNEDKEMDDEVRKIYNEYLKKAEDMMTKKQKDLLG
ncbi:ribosome-recycling factor, mitochondrial-like [Argopecten irradians]|uniref:ribosome-recycling factor, mitochondrial-like n=1 Tax=Argopecten irradians TaxID=31199 RepID=UPI00371D34FB